MQPKEHWEKVYEIKPKDAVSWFQEHAEQSLRLICETGVPLICLLLLPQRKFLSSMPLAFFRKIEGFHAIQ